MVICLYDWTQDLGSLVRGSVWWLWYTAIHDSTGLLTTTPPLNHTAPMCTHMSVWTHTTRYNPSHTRQAPQALSHPHMIHTPQHNPHTIILPTHPHVTRMLPHDPHYLTRFTCSHLIHTPSDILSSHAITWSHIFMVLDRIVSLGWRSCLYEIKYDCFKPLQIYEMTYEPTKRPRILLKVSLAGWAGWGLVAPSLVMKLRTTFMYTRQYVFGTYTMMLLYFRSK